MTKISGPDTHPEIPGHPSAKSLTLSRSLYALVLDHLRTVYPEEGCGFIAGRDGVAQAVYPVENRLHSPVAYEMDPRQQVETMLAIADAGLEVIGIYHSHPQGPAGLSASDLASITYPQAWQLIISFARPEAPAAGLFAVENGRVEPVTLNIE